MTTKSVFSADFNRQDVITYLDNAFGKAMTPSPMAIDDAANFRKDADAANIDKALYIGEYPNRIKVYDITLRPNCHIARARVGIKRLVTQLMDNYSYAILLFHYDENATNKEWRISWVTKGSGNTHTNAAKRYTFLCGTMHPSRTIADRLRQISTSKGSSLPEKITEAFSVEALSGDFFDEYKAFYEDIVQYICGVRYVKKGNGYVRKPIESKTTIKNRGIFENFVKQVPNKISDEEKRIEEAEKLVRDYVKKLLGRLVFIQFIAKKGWMGLKQNDAWGAGNEHFLLNLYKNASQQDKNDFVKNILKGILFDSLNNNPNGKTDHLGVKVNVKTINAIDYKFPYLNGGLFEETALDNLGINIPGYFFVSDEKDSRGIYYLDDDKNAPKNTPRMFVEVAKKKSKKKNGEEIENAPYPYDQSEGLFEFFERYNFTIDENDSDEAVVGIDPEMLGKIFENLLEDNKDKGAFYTPKPVVEYMCQQSLIAYLQNGVLEAKSESSDKSSDSSQKVDIEALSAISDDEIKAQIEQFVKTKSLRCTNSVESRQGLGEVGGKSGEETEGKCMPIELVSLLNKLLKEVKICDPAIGSGAFPMGLLNELLACREVLQSCGGVQELSRAELKKEIIQNNIYGVDIEEGAIEIARLRFWLSIVIDLEKPEALPNFDYKFMQGNSLIEQYEGIDLSNIVAMKKKQKCEVSCDLFGKVEGIDKDTLYLSDTMFEFDLQKTINDYFNISDHNEKQKKKSEIDEYLKCVICHTLSVKAVELNGTISNLKAVDNLKPKQQKVLEETENEYNRLQEVIKNFHSAICDKFFLWHLWFKNVFDNGGFDIVIGNPPYGAKLSDKDKAFFREHYVTAQTIKEDPKNNIVGQKGSLNTYTLFIELAYNIGCDNGSVSMIVPLSITSSESVDATHKLIFNNCRDFHVSSYAVAPQPVFKNAVVNVSIISFMKVAGTDMKVAGTENKVYSTKMYRKSKKDEKFSLQYLINNLEFTDVQDYLLLGRIPKIGKDIERDILAKLKQNAKPLSAYIDQNGSSVYYRFAGGRYFKVVTPYTTNSSAETSIKVDANMMNCICCILSSSLSFWFYQIYSDNLNWKSIEVLGMPIPNIPDDKRMQIENLYERYLDDIKKNARTCKTKEGNSYKVPTFEIYKIRKSFPIIDEIDDLIGPLYGLTPEEIDFIKNYERTFREDDDEDENSETGKPKRKKK